MLPEDVDADIRVDQRHGAPARFSARRRSARESSGLSPRSFQMPRAPSALNCSRRTPPGVSPSCTGGCFPGSPAIRLRRNSSGLLPSALALWRSRVSSSSVNSMAIVMLIPFVSRLPAARLRHPLNRGPGVFSVTARLKTGFPGAEPGSAQKYRSRRIRRRAPASALAMPGFARTPTAW